MSLRRAVLFAGLFAAGAATAGWLDFEVADEPWQELQAPLPAAPRDPALVPFAVSAASRHRYYIDPASLSVGGDGVVRYTVVVRTASGTENVSFEGMRCATGEHKGYAFGRPGGEWSRNRYARWEKIDLHRAASHQRELFYHYFCTMQGPANLKVIEDALRRGGLDYAAD